MGTDVSRDVTTMWPHRGEDEVPQTCSDLGLAAVAQERPMVAGSHSTRQGQRNTWTQAQKSTHSENATGSGSTVLRAVPCRKTGSGRNKLLAGEETPGSQLRATAATRCGLTPAHCPRQRLLWP